MEDHFSLYIANKLGAAAHCDCGPFGLPSVRQANDVSRERRREQQRLMPTEHRLRHAPQRRQEPQVQHAMRRVRPRQPKMAHAALDVSDGLLADLAEVSQTLDVPITAIGRMRPSSIGKHSQLTVLDGSGSP